MAHRKDGGLGNHAYHLESPAGMEQVACLHTYVLYGQHDSALYTGQGRACLPHNTHNSSHGLTPTLFCFISLVTRQCSPLFMYSPAFMSRLPRRGRPPRYRLRPAACLASWPDLVCAKNFETGSACLKRSFRLREGLDYVADGLFTSHKLPHTWFC